MRVALFVALALTTWTASATLIQFQGSGVVGVLDATDTSLAAFRADTGLSGIGPFRFDFTFSIDDQTFDPAHISNEGFAVTIGDALLFFQTFAFDVFRPDFISISASKDDGSRATVNLSPTPGAALSEATLHALATESLAGYSSFNTPGSSFKSPTWSTDGGTRTIARVDEPSALVLLLGSLAAYGFRRTRPRRPHVSGYGTT